ncbi:MAG: tRNA (adenosine(37)-N6)-threonylcarbamoyltransferase complex dimerization subunit type 1 TsaB [Acidiferrobacter sp.]
MNVLAIETATASVSVALGKGETVYERHVRDATARAETVLDLLRALCAETETRLEAIDAIAFGRGPGSFTGLRVAAAVAQGLAYPRDLPVIPVSSLAALAQGAPGRRILAALDARRDEVYYGCFRRADNGLVVPEADEQVGPPDCVSCAMGVDIAVGSGVDQYVDRFLPALVQTRDPGRVPTASAVLALSLEAYARGAWVHACDALPVYLRDDVAQARI